MQNLRRMTIKAILHVYESLSYDYEIAGKLLFQEVS